MRELIDTNVLSEIRKKHRGNRRVQSWALAHDSALWAVSVLSLGEIRRGIEDVRARDLAQAVVLERWLHGLHKVMADRILPITAGIADRWGRMLSEHQLPPSDAWLAATAAEHDLTIVTRNTSDFERAGVRVVNPFL